MFFKIPPQRLYLTLNIELGLLMKRAFILLLLIIPICGIFPVYGSDVSLKRRQLYAGPEWYHLWRTKKGGTKQQGNMVGVRYGYDRLKRYGWYWGCEALYAEGTLKGQLGDDAKLHSHATDMSVEGRIGYTFQQKDCLQLSFTPFVGGGYAVEKNYFKDPSPLPLHFLTHYPFAMAGFLSWMHLCDRVELGLNFKARFPVDPKCRVTNDPRFPPVTQVVGERLHYRIDLPLTYRVTCDGANALSLVPFYESRYYGSRMNYPFDYFKTKLSSWGLSLLILHRL